MHILITDDHAVVRRGLKEILLEEFRGASIDEAVDAEDALRQLGHKAPSLLVLDINMPGRSGVDLLGDVKRRYPRLPVIILSVQPDEQYALRCLKAGASAYINKDSAADELGKAAHKVVNGGRYVGAGLAVKLVDILEDSNGKPKHQLLSDRELEVMLMIASGVSLTDIGDRLHVSAKTVSTYRARLLEKMQMKTNAELTRYAVAHSLIE